MVGLWCWCCFCGGDTLALMGFSRLAWKGSSAAGTLGFSGFFHLSPLLANQEIQDRYAGAG